MVFRSFKNWKRQRREERRIRKLGEVSGYPPDMRRDVVETIIQVRQYTMTSTERLHGLCEAVRYLDQAGIQGSVVECGVWRGGSMMAVASMFSKLGDTTRDLHLYDTFDGMSQPTDKDVAVTGERADQLLAAESRQDATSVWCLSTLDEVKQHMRDTNYPEQQIHYHVGKVEDTIGGDSPDGVEAEKIALLRLDTDWYESTAHELEHLFPKLVDGGVLIIDDYGHWQGARQAVDEYFEKHHIGMMLHRLDYTGRIGIHHQAMTRKMPSQSADDLTTQAA